MTDQLARFRAQIDELDRRWVRVLAARFAVTGQVGRYKKRHHLSIVDDQREYEQCVRIRQLAVAEGLDPDVAERFLRCILEEVVRRHAAPTKAE